MHQRSISDTVLAEGLIILEFRSVVEVDLKSLSVFILSLIRPLICASQHSPVFHDSSSSPGGDACLLPGPAALRLFSFNLPRAARFNSSASSTWGLPLLCLLRFAVATVLPPSDSESLSTTIRRLPGRGLDSSGLFPFVLRVPHFAVCLAQAARMSPFKQCWP